MDNQQQDRGTQPGYHTPGSDKIVESSSSAVPSPSKTSEERLQDPKPVIESIGETPGDANPALAETIGAEQGRVSTAQELLARETAEEERLRAASAPIYEDQGIGDTPGEFGETAGDHDPNYPYDRRGEYSTDYLDAPHVEDSFRTQAEIQGVGQLQGRADWTMDKAGQAAAENAARAGRTPVGGGDADIDRYERQEMHNPYPIAEVDDIASDMTNIPDETKNG